MDEDKLTQEMQEILREELEDDQEDRLSEQDIDNRINAQEWQDAYGSPEPDEQQNAHSFLHRAAFDNDIDGVRTTFLSEWELGKPLFSVRFLLDMEDIAKHYLDELSYKLGLKNKIALYFFDKVKNITTSGMSNKGFSMNLNVTRKMDTTRKRVKVYTNKMKGGDKKDGF